MITLKDDVLIIDYNKEAETAVKILQKFRSKDQPVFYDIAFQRNEKNTFSFYASNSKSLAEYVTDCDLPIDDDMGKGRLKWNSMIIDKQCTMISFSRSSLYYPPCSRLFEGFEKHYGLHIENRKDFIAFLKDVIKESMNYQEQSFIKFFYDNDVKEIKIKRWLRNDIDIPIAVTHTNVTSIGTETFFENGSEIKVEPAELLKILSSLKGHTVDFYFMKEVGQLYFEEGQMRYLLMSI